jgi:hypothetical protein
VCLLFGKKKKKINKYGFVLGSFGERNKIMKDFVLLRKRLRKERRRGYNK